MAKIPHVLLLVEWLLLGLGGGALIAAYPLTWGMLLGVPIPRTPNLLPYLGFALVSGALATFLRERFFAVFWRVFTVFTVISVYEVLRIPFLLWIAGENAESFWLSADRAIQLVPVLGALIYVLVSKARSSVKNLHRALIAGVLSILALFPLAWLVAGTHWPIFLGRSFTHGFGVAAIALLATLAYVLLGLCPLFREPRKSMA